MARSASRSHLIVAALCALWAVACIKLAGGGWLRPYRATAAPPTAARPHIVLFVIDTLRADRLGCYGYAAATTPRIDALAAEGVRFAQASAPAPWTLPSMGSVMLSRFACEHGALSTRTRLPDGVPTLAERLSGLGYHALGLYANGMVAAEFGFDRGFARYQPSGENGAEQVAELLRQAPGGPLFLYVHNIEPHNPERDAPPVPGISEALRREMHERYKRYRSATRVDYTLGRPVGASDTTAEQERELAFFRAHLDEWSRLYDAAIGTADQRLGSVIDWLKQRGEWDNTLFILISDHGEEFFEHGGWTHGQAVYEEQLRVPLVIKLPGGAFAGQTVDAPVSLVDLLPTVFAWLGREDQATDAVGRDLLPLLRDREARPAGPRVLALRHNVMNHYRPLHVERGDFQVVVRDGDWKAIWHVERERVELFDLATDPAEQRERSAEHPVAAESLRTFAQTWLEQCRPLHPGGQPLDDMEGDTLQTLRALGYAD